MRGQRRERGDNVLWVQTALLPFLDQLQRHARSEKFAACGFWRLPLVVWVLEQAFQPCRVYLTGTRQRAVAVIGLRAAGQLCHGSVNQDIAWPGVKRER